MKKITAVFLSFLLLFSFSTVAYADVIVEVDDWSLAKTPTNKSWEIRAYNGEDTQIELLDSNGLLNITSLGPYAFAENTEITNVTMNPHLQKIKEYAFLNSNVSSIHLNNNLFEIGKGAFSGTSLLTSINLEDTGVQDIEEYTFLNSGINEITLPDVCRTIADGAFMQCVSFEKITIPESVTEISDTAFDGCENVVIYCYTDSFAHHYAEEREIEYVLIDAPVPVTFILGDADSDGKISVLDATTIQKCLALLIEDTDGLIHLAGSVDGEKLNVLHATYIQKYLAMIDVDVPIGKEVTVEVKG